MSTTRTLLLGGAAALALAGAVAGCSPEPSAQGEAAAATVAAEDPNYLYPDQSTPLMWAVYEQDAERVARLIAAGADVSASNLYGSNAMQLAAEVADVGILTQLLEAGADADSPNPEGQTALMLVARTGNVEAAKLLVEHGATIDAREGWGEQTALMWAAAQRHPEMVAYLIEQGADMNARSKWRDYQRHITSEARAKQLDTGGLTPLLYAARENCVECVRVLIDKGADVDLPDPDRVSPLLLSILNTNWDVAKLLIEAGADVDQWDIFGQTPLHAVASRRTSTSRISIDPAPASSGSEILDLLLAKGAYVNAQLFTRPAKQRGAGGKGATPLHAAASSGDLEAVKKLIAAGADVNLNTADNQSALMFAAQSLGGSGGFFGGGGGGGGRGGVAIIGELQAAGADPNAVALYHHLSRIRGGTALHYAVRAGSGQAIDALVAMGADVNIKDPDGLTALDYAEARGYIPFLQMRQPPRPDLAQKLRDAGATVALAEEPAWAPVGPPVYYEASIWPLAPDLPTRTYENTQPLHQPPQYIVEVLEPSPYVVDAVASLRYTGTPQPQQAQLDGARGQTRQAQLEDEAQQAQLQ